MKDNVKIAIFLAVVGLLILLQQYFGYASHELFNFSQLHHESFALALFFGALMVYAFGRKKV